MTSAKEETMNLPKSSAEFKKTYLLKAELLEICQTLGLPRSGSKEDLTNTICSYIDGKPIVKKEIQSRKKLGKLSPSSDQIISENYANDDIHREFFIKEIGTHFKFNIQFMNWMKTNKGKLTYHDAIVEWERINDEKKKGIKFEIGKQFEYNQYTRDFFNANPEKSKADCLKCWNFKKSNLGHHKYEKSDLEILTD